MVDLDMVIDALVPFVIENAISIIPKFLLAFFTLVVGMKAIAVVTKTITAIMHREKMDPSLISFSKSFFNIGAKLLLFISIAAMIGIETTSIVAVLGATSLAVGLALQGSLSNFAGGVIIMVFKPFTVTDFIEAGPFRGTVEKIEIFHTTLTTLDNKSVVIPNGKLSNEDLVNYTSTPTIRKDLAFGVAYGSDMEKVKKVVNEILAKDKKVLKDPKPIITINEFGDSSINVIARVWCNNSDYTGLHFDINDAIEREFKKNKIQIPFPQRDVHLYKH